jgi:hypothetical protein
MFYKIITFYDSRVLTVFIGTFVDSDKLVIWAFFNVFLSGGELIFINHLTIKRPLAFFCIFATAIQNVISLFFLDMEFCLQVLNIR